MSKLTQKPHGKDCVNAGDYAVAISNFPPGTPITKSVILACPFCGKLMACAHKIISENPLTLSPSVVGPQNTLYWCGHHFMVEKGEVV